MWGVVPVDGVIIGTLPVGLSPNVDKTEGSTHEPLAPGNCYSLLCFAYTYFVKALPHFSLDMSIVTCRIIKMKEEGGGFQPHRA
jgi:hypothetical protein